MATAQEIEAFFSKRGIEVSAEQKDSFIAIYAGEVDAKKIMELVNGISDQTRITVITQKQSWWKRINAYIKSHTPHIAR